MDYRLHPNNKTLEKWKDVVFNTADFLASIAHYDTLKDEYVLGPPLIPVSENIGYMDTFNPTFELSYWRFGLRVDNENDLYVLHEGVKDMWTKYNYEHPALIGIYGMLRGDGVDPKILENTFNKILSVWNFKKVWGWDFPMLAMTAARVNKPEKAIDLLLQDNFKFDQHGLSSGGGPFAYFPANGGLLTAIAMMAGGWDGAPGKNAPGFPDNGQWVVKCEKFRKAL